jgi:hypothetical protein
MTAIQRDLWRQEYSRLRIVYKMEKATTKEKQIWETLLHSRRKTPLVAKCEHADGP